MNYDNAIAVISDIHSNVYALEAVLRDIDLRGIKAIVNLGDTLFGPIDPLKTAEILMNRPNLIHIMGNCDRYLLQEEMNSITFHYESRYSHRKYLHGFSPFIEPGLTRSCSSAMEPLSQMIRVSSRRLHSMESWQRV
ncbi:metallophosphoesterase family protein [Brevibacillus panacihumi]|uniref:metallophosphoesterase family protein n=1 Tax=Brevibacillus panacihumi TaxID=497735 RepID=UPI0026A603A0